MLRPLFLRIALPSFLLSLFCPSIPLVVGMDHIQLSHTLAEAFNALADEVQHLADRKTVLEHKLRFAHEQVSRVGALVLFRPNCLGLPIPKRPILPSKPRDRTPRNVAKRQKHDEISLALDQEQHSLQRLTTFTPLNFGLVDDDFFHSTHLSLSVASHHRTTLPRVQLLTRRALVAVPVSGR